MQRIRQPRVAELVASRLRDDILTGRLTEGDVLPSQEALFAEFGVSPPAVREAVHILESDGLISVRRGNVGGALVHLPSAERTAQMISMVLQTRAATPGDVSEALLHLEPDLVRRSIGAFILIIAVLVVRPTGLLGNETQKLA